MKIIKFNDFSGGKNVAIEASKIADNEALDVINLKTNPVGSLKARKGISYTHSSPLTDFDDNTGCIVNQKIIKLSSGTKWHLFFVVSDTATAADIKGQIITDPTTETLSLLGATIEKSTSFSSLRDASLDWEATKEDVITVDQIYDYVIAANPNNKPIIWNGVGNFSSVTGAPVAGIVKVWKDYVFLGDIENYPYRIRWSDVADPTTWPSSNYVDLDPNDTVTGIAALGNQIIIFQTNSIWALEYTGAILQFIPRRIISGVGALAPNAILEVGNSVYFISNRFQIEEVISNTIRPFGLKVANTMMQQASPKLIKHSKAIQNPLDNELWFAFPNGYQNQLSNVILVYNSVSNSWYQFGGWTEDRDVISDFSCYSLMRYYVPELNLDYISLSDKDGYLLSYTSSATTDKGNNFTKIFRSKWIELGGKTFRVLRLRFVVGFSSSASITIKIRKDYDVSDYVSKTISTSFTSPQDTKKIVDFDETFTCNAFRIDLETTADDFTLHEIEVFVSERGKRFIIK